MITIGAVRVHVARAVTLKTEVDVFIVAGSSFLSFLRPGHMMFHVCYHVITVRSGSQSIREKDSLLRALFSDGLANRTDVHLGNLIVARDADRDTVPKRTSFSWDFLEDIRSRSESHMDL